MALVAMLLLAKGSVAISSVHRRVTDLLAKGSAAISSVHHRTMALVAMLLLVRVSVAISSAPITPHQRSSAQGKIRDHDHHIKVDMVADLAHSNAHRIRVGMVADPAHSSGHHIKVDMVADPAHSSVHHIAMAHLEAPHVQDRDHVPLVRHAVHQDHHVLRNVARLPSRKSPPGHSISHLRFLSEIWLSS
jgi:hypothetical protein